MLNVPEHRQQGVISMSIRRKFWLSISALLLPLFSLGCLTTAAINERSKEVHRDIEKARKSGAYRCSPRHLAEAEANLEFTRNELREGDALRASDHIQLAQTHIKQALIESKGCGPKRVLIKKPQKPKKPVVIKIQKTDKDGDGIFDDVDQCPDEAEDMDQFEDEDGCPDVDNDKDGIFDTDDLCPNTPGEASNQGCPVEDRDGDGIVDKVDKCPDQPEDIDGDSDEDGCPDDDLDSDGDGILDKVDKCPNNPEDMDGFEDEDGCPEVDNDKDGLLDSIDQCPNDAGPPENKGCPILDRDKDGVMDPDDKCPDVPGLKQFAGCPDRDGDGIEDAIDKCPDEPGIAEEQGCPKKYSLIVVKKDRIEIKQKVHFATGKARILRNSFELLSQIGDAIKTAKLKKVLIEGHTDSRGSDSYNMRLSQRRANAVRKHLIDKAGVDEEVLEAVGFGETRPIASNRSKKGRAQNRRVEFKIIER